MINTRIRLFGLLMVCIAHTTLAMEKTLTSELGSLESELFEQLNVISEVSLDSLRELLKAGVDVNARDDDNGMTPLMHAAYNGHFEAWELLLEAGVDIEIDNDGWSCLRYAIDQGHTEIAASAIENGADTDIPYSYGMSALMLAADNGMFEMCKVLLGAGYEVDDTDNDGKTALRYAVGNQKVWDLLIEHGADPDSVADDGLTPDVQRRIEEALPKGESIILPGDFL